MFTVVMKYSLFKYSGNKKEIESLDIYGSTIMIFPESDLVVVKSKAEFFNYTDVKPIIEGVYPFVGSRERIYDFFSDVREITYFTVFGPKGTVIDLIESDEHSAAKHLIKAQYPIDEIHCIYKRKELHFKDGGKRVEVPEDTDILSILQEYANMVL